MPIINVKLIEDVVTPDQKREIIERLTDVMVSIEGENLRPVAWVVVEEVAGGDMGVGGKPLSTEDVKALAAGVPAYIEAWSPPGAATAMITAPTLVIWGERDRYLGPTLAEPHHDDVPNLERVERLPDASHWVHHDEPERVNQLLVDFFAHARSTENRPRRRRRLSTGPPTSGDARLRAVREAHPSTPSAKQGARHIRHRDSHPPVPGWDSRGAAR